MTLAEALDTTHIHRVAGLTGARTALVTTRPFRAAYHISRLDVTLRLSANRVSKCAHRRAGLYTRSACKTSKR
jgi:hypothetical protein